MVGACLQRHLDRRVRRAVIEDDDLDLPHAGDLARDLSDDGGHIGLLIVGRDRHDQLGKGRGFGDCV